MSVLNRSFVGGLEARSKADRVLSSDIAVECPPPARFRMALETVVGCLLLSEV